MGRRQRRVCSDHWVAEHHGPGDHCNVNQGAQCRHSVLDEKHKLEVRVDNLCDAVELQPYFYFYFIFIYNSLNIFIRILLLQQIVQNPIEILIFVYRFNCYRLNTEVFRMTMKFTGARMIVARRTASVP
jgi:hypothetical protein